LGARAVVEGQRFGIGRMGLLSRRLMIRAPLNVLKSRRQNRSHRNDRVKDPSKEGDQHFTMRQYCNHRCCDDCVTDLGPAPSRPPAPDDKKRSSRGRCLHPQKTLRRLPGAAQPTRSAKNSGHHQVDIRTSRLPSRETRGNFPWRRSANPKCSYVSPILGCRSSGPLSGPHTRDDSLPLLWIGPALSGL
jgi:hypothetical protein